MAEEQKQKLHKPILDHNGKPYSPNQVLSLVRAQLVEERINKERKAQLAIDGQLIPREAVIRQAGALFAAVRAKLLLIPRTLCHKLVDKNHREICDLMTVEIYKALHEMANFDQEVVRSDWKPGSNGDPFKQAKGGVRRRVKLRGDAVGQ
jgi:hypothetical protein